MANANQVAAETQMTAPLPKPSQLHSAIERLGCIENRLKMLSDNIGGHPVPTDKIAGVPDGPNQTLQEILDHGPNQIHERIEGCLSLIAQIENQLF